MRTGPVAAVHGQHRHHVHHLNARIPFYRLPEIVAALPELQEPKTTSLQLGEILRCLRLKVWDGTAQRMVGSGALRSPSLRNLRESVVDPG
jgi:omega-6 fatty acid desaturase (delta-12 desaturase)